LLKEHMDAYENAHYNSIKYYNDVLDIPRDILQRMSQIEDSLDARTSALYASVNTLFDAGDNGAAMEIVDFAVNNCPYYSMAHNLLGQVCSGFDELCYSQKRFLRPSEVDIAVFRNWAGQSFDMARIYHEKPLILAEEDSGSFYCSLIHPHIETILEHGKNTLIVANIKHWNVQDFRCEASFFDTLPNHNVVRTSNINISDYLFTRYKLLNISVP